MWCKRRVTGSLAAAAMLVAISGCAGARPARSAVAGSDKPPLTSATEQSNQPVVAPAAAAATAPGTAPASVPAGAPATAPATPAPTGAVNPSTPVSQPAAPVSKPAAPAPSQPAQQSPAPVSTPAPQPAAPGKPAPPATAPPSGSTPQSQGFTFTTIAQGQHSGSQERRAVLIQDQASLSAQGIRPQGAIDFSRESVLVVYMGEQNTGGYSVAVTSVTLSGGKLMVTVKQNRPSPGGMTTQALTQPYHAVKMPKVPAGTQLSVNWL